jgi:hypothetical protein
MAANTTTPPTAPPTIAPIGTLLHRLINISTTFRCKATTHLEDLLDAGLFVSDPVGDAPAAAEFVADEPVIVAEFTSDTPYQPASMLAWPISAKGRLYVLHCCIQTRNTP